MVVQSDLRSPSATILETRLAELAELPGVEDVETES